MEEEGTLYSIVPDEKNIHSSLMEYCNFPEIKRASFDKDSERHVYVTKDGSERTCKGLHSYIWKTFVPRDYVQPTRKRSKTINYKKKSTTATIGRRVSKCVEGYVAKNGERPLPPRRSASKISKRVYNFFVAIIDWLSCNGYEIQVAELPVVFDKLNRMTRADLITKDRTGKRLVVWEIKCGWPPAAQRHGKHFKEPLDSVSCATFNKWFIQAIYTNAGLKNRGLDSVCVKILHCWEEEEIEFSKKIPGKRKREAERPPQSDSKKKIVYKVESRSMPEWAKRHEEYIRDKI